MNTTLLNSNSLIINALKAIKEKNYQEAKNILEKTVLLYPNSFEANHNLAILNFQLGNIDKSIEYFNKSKNLKPKFSQVYFNLALAYDKKNMVDHAIKNFKKAIKIEPNNSLALHQIGLMYKKKNNFKSSEEYFKKSLNLNPVFEENYNQLFSIYESLNQNDKFTKLLDEAKKILNEQDLLDFYSAILQYKKKNYEIVIDILNKIELDEKYYHQNLAKHTFLAKSYDQIKKYDSAFHHYKQNNELTNKYYGKNINEKNFISYVNQRVEFFNNFNLEKWAQYPGKYKSTDPIFLIGFPRSGTTLLDTILRTNSSVEVIEEKPILRNFLIILEKKTNNDFRNLNKLNQNYINEMQNVYFSEREKYLQNRNAKVVIDKMPLNIIHIAEILRFFPNAKFIFALRNPYDCVLSCFMQQFQLNPAMKNFLSLESSAYLYNLVMKLWKIYSKIFKINCHFIKYEETVLNFEKTTKDLFEFLGLNWSNEVNNFFITARKREFINTPSYDQVTSPLYSKSLNRWKNYEKYFDSIKNTLDFWVNEFNYKN